MLTWLLHGLRGGTATSSYPRRPERPPTGFQGQVTVLDGVDGSPALEALCPTSAIRVMADRQVELDRGRCIQCGNCVRSVPERFAFTGDFESASAERAGLVETTTGDLGPIQTESETLANLGPSVVTRGRPALGDTARSLRRSIHIRHIDTGSDGSEEWEIQSLWNPHYDIQRLGFFLTSSPRHADILLVTGPVTAAMRKPLELTWELLPEPKALVAVGTDACTGGFAAGLDSTAGGVDKVLPVDVYIPGSPPSPIAIIDGLLLAVGLICSESGR
jgi:Ni,Fe-hydrogenase III small subunit/ferredoxin